MFRCGLLNIYVHFSYMNIKYNWIVERIPQARKSNLLLEKVELAQATPVCVQNNERKKVFAFLILNIIYRLTARIIPVISYWE